MASNFSLVSFLSAFSTALRAIFMAQAGPHTFCSGRMGVNGTPQDLHFLLANVYPIVGAPRLQPCDELRRLLFGEFTGL